MGAGQPDIAPATANATGPPVPTVVKMLTNRFDNYHRIWSDGRADRFERPVNGDCDEFELVISHGAVEHPFPVVDAVLGDTSHDPTTVMLTYEDGRVDLIGGSVFQIRCTIAGIGTPSFCTGDVDRDGAVGIEDFLIVLGQWGQPCQ